MKKSLRIVLPAAVIAASLLFAVVLVLSRPDVETAAPEAPRPWVRTLEVTQQPVRMHVHSQGTVAPRTESALVSEVSGRIQEISPYFAAGGFFGADDTLVWIDPRDYEAHVAQARSQVAQADVRLALEEQEARVARAEWKRLNADPIPPLVAREPQLQEARAALEAARAGLAQAELNLDRTRIRVPYRGRVRSKQVDVGQYVTAGMIVAQVYAVDYVEVRLPLPDRELAYLGIPFDFNSVRAGREGPEVVLRATFAGESSQWRGYITRIEGEVDRRTRMVHAVARVENPYGRTREQAPLAVGMFVEAEIKGESRNDLVMIPRSAVRQDGRVLVVDADSRLHFRDVEVERTLDDHAYISAGLAPGDVLCISPLAAATEGMAVRIYDGERDADITDTTQVDAP